MFLSAGEGELKSEFQASRMWDTEERGLGNTGSTSLA